MKQSQAELLLPPPACRCESMLVHVHMHKRDAFLKRGAKASRTVSHPCNLLLYTFHIL